MRLCWLAAGIRRQGIDNDSDFVYEYLSVKEMLPAAGQAVIAMETKKGTLANELAEKISDVHTAGVSADRARGPHEIKCRMP